MSNFFLLFTLCVKINKINMGIILDTKRSKTLPFQIKMRLIVFKPNIHGAIWKY
jgi:hypothetical protein